MILLSWQRSGPRLHDVWMFVNGHVATVEEIPCGVAATKRVSRDVIWDFIIRQN